MGNGYDRTPDREMARRRQASPAPDTPAVAGVRHSLRSLGFDAGQAALSATAAPAPEQREVSAAGGCRDELRELLRRMTGVRDGLYEVALLLLRIVRPGGGAPARPGWARERETTELMERGLSRIDDASGCIGALRSMIDASRTDAATLSDHLDMAAGALERAHVELARLPREAGYRADEWGLRLSVVRDSCRELAESLAARPSGVPMTATGKASTGMGAQTQPGPAPDHVSATAPLPGPAEPAPGREPPPAEEGPAGANVRDFLQHISALEHGDASAGERWLRSARTRLEKMSAEERNAARASKAYAAFVQRLVGSGDPAWMGAVTLANRIDSALRTGDPSGLQTGRQEKAR